jgi:hypothetical protein
MSDAFRDNTETEPDRPYRTDGGGQACITRLQEEETQVDQLKEGNEAGQAEWP